MSESNTQSIRVIDVADPSRGNVLNEIVINSYSSLTITAYWCAMNFIAKNMARFPRSVVDPDAAEDAPPHPLTSLLKKRPNGYQNPFRFWATWFFHAAHTGNGYAWIERAGQRPLALHNAKPEDVYPFRFTPEGGTTEQFYLLKRSKKIVAGADMLHLTGLSYDGQSGIDPVDLHQGTFQRGSMIDRYQTKFLQKGTVVRGSIEIPGDVPDDKLQLMKSYLREKFYGIDAEEDVIVLTFGGQLKNATLDPEKSQMVEQARHSTKQVAQITGIPPEFLFEQSEAKYNNSVEQAGQNVVRYALGSWIEQAQDELSMKLLTEREQDAGLKIRLNPDVLIRGSTKEQMDVVSRGVDAGIYTPNEGREMLGKPRLEDPEADMLKRRGDTSPQGQDQQNPPENTGQNA